MSTNQLTEGSIGGRGLGDVDFEAIESAVMETARGRWFLAEYARRQCRAETEHHGRARCAWSHDPAAAAPRLVLQGIIPVLARPQRLGGCGKLSEQIRRFQSRVHTRRSLAGLTPYALRAPCVRAQGGLGARTGIRFARDMHGLWVKGIKLTK